MIKLIINSKGVKKWMGTMNEKLPPHTPFSFTPLIFVTTKRIVSVQVFH